VANEFTYPKVKPSEVQLWINFTARNYTNRRASRAAGGGNALRGRGPLFQATLPVPPNMSSSSSIEYNEGESTTTPLIEGALTAAGQQGGFFRTLGGLVSQLPIVKGLSPSLLADLTVGGYIGLVDMDRQELLFSGAGNRTFQFNFSMLARSNEEAVLISQLATAFEAHSLPEPSNLTNEKMYHPPLWQWYVFGSNGRQYRNLDAGTWTGFSQTSVLTDVRVNRTGAGGAFSTPIGDPIAITLSLSFTELEPNLRFPGSNVIGSNSQIITRDSF
tara:strand:- start:59 stop:880 length:822 start_codon:yes stop_codon:yes gene_type:complete